MRIAGFPMYDFVEIRSATNDLWHALQNNLITLGLRDVPVSLVRPDDLQAFWSNTDLLIGQTCGYPFKTGVCGNARYVATPCYHTRFSKGPAHKSLIVVHQHSHIDSISDARGKICAINMADSNTGMNLLRLEIAKLQPASPFFSRVYETQAHRKSMQAVADGEADIAAIDCITFALVEQIDPSMTKTLKILAETEETPSLPFITSAETDERTLSALREALHMIIMDPRQQNNLKILMIEDIVVLPEQRYDRIIDIEKQSIALGYPKLI